MLSDSSEFHFMVKYQSYRGLREQYFKFRSEALEFAEKQFDAEIWRKVKYKKNKDKEK